MCGTLKFSVLDEEGCVMAAVEVAFEGKKGICTAHNMVNTYLYDLIEQLEREEASACVNG